MIKGLKISAVIDTANCKLVKSHGNHENKKTLHFALSFPHLWHYSVNNEERILGFDNILIKNPEHGVKWMNIELEVKQDKSAEVTIEFLYADNYQSMSKTTYQCALSDGKNNKGVSLFYS